jgi:tRNA U38,U39,U40 pseudouridine synthase TruA
MTTAVYDNTTSGATATNVQDAIDEVFQSVSNGKTLIAAAITDKGVPTAASDSFSTMATNIRSIDTSAIEGADIFVPNKLLSSNFYTDSN